MGLVLFTLAAKVIRPPPMFRICTVAVAIVRLHMSRESTTLVELTSRIGTLFNCPMGITIKPEVDVANRFWPSGDAMIFDVICSERRKPSCGVRLDERRICKTAAVCWLCAAPGAPGKIPPPGNPPPPGIVTPGVAGFCGLLGLRGLIGVCAQHAAPLLNDA